ncbi:MAG: hypothetical protein AABW90_03825 [Nanoarchaeota archaeon]
MTFDLEGRKPIYTTPDKAVSFIPNLKDGPEAYDVIIKEEDHFYIADRTLSDLTNPEISTDKAMTSLENMCGGMVGFILQKNNLFPKDIHIALLQLRIMEQQKEIDYAYSAKIG